MLQILFGGALGGIVPGISALLANYAHEGDEGAIYGLNHSIFSSARMIGPFVGVSVGMWLGLRAVFVGAATLYAATAVLAAFGLPELSKKSDLK